MNFDLANGNKLPIPRNRYTDTQNGRSRLDVEFYGPTSTPMEHVDGTRMFNLDELFCIKAIKCLGQQQITNNIVYSKACKREPYHEQCCLNQTVGANGLPFFVSNYPMDGASVVTTNHINVFPNYPQFSSWVVRDRIFNIILCGQNQTLPKFKV